MSSHFSQFSAVGDPAADPTTPSSSSTPNGQNTKPKRTLIESACGACRKRKSRCDGVRPICTRCQTLRSECVYQVEEGESRWSALRRKNSELQSEKEQLKELLVSLQTRSEPEAQAILRRIRACTSFDDVQDIIAELRSGSLDSLEQGDANRLPPLRYLLQSGDEDTPMSGSDRRGSSSGPKSSYGSAPQ